MIRRKGLIAGVLATSVLAAALTGCGSKAEDEKTTGTETGTTTEGSTTEVADDNTSFKAKEPVSFTMLFNDMPNYPENSDWLLWKEIKERTNVSLDLTIVPMSDYTQKRSLLISTGDAPYIMPKTYPGQEVAFISSGAILPISDYVNLMPNYSKKVEEWGLEEEVEKLRQEDGKYYVLPGLHESATQDYSFAVRTDILEELGLEVPTTYDEFYEMLKKMKEAYPDVTPWSDKYQFKSASNVAATSFGVSCGWGAGDGTKYDSEKDEFFFAPTSDKYKEFVTYFNKLVSEGLLDQESFTQNDDMAVQKFVTGKAFVCSANSQDMISFRNTMSDTLGGDYEIAKIVPPNGPAGNVISGSRLENGIMFSAAAAKDDNFEDMIKFVDWLWYSDEGQLLTKWGVEGTTYNVVNDKYELTDDVTFQSLNPDGTIDLRKEYGFSGGVFAYGGNDKLKYSMMSDEDVEFNKQIQESKTLEAISPATPYSEDELEQRTLLTTPLMDYVSQMTLKFILGTSSIEKEWDSYVKECEAKGSIKITDQTNEVSKRNK